MTVFSHPGVTLSGRRRHDRALVVQSRQFQQHAQSPFAELRGAGPA
jgi:hypothetical protein